MTLPLLYQSKDRFRNWAELRPLQTVYKEALFLGSVPLIW